MHLLIVAQAEYLVCVAVSWKYLTEWTELMSNEPPTYHGKPSRIDLFGNYNRCVTAMRVSCMQVDSDTCTTP